MKLLIIFIGILLSGCVGYAHPYREHSTMRYNPEPTYFGHPHFENRGYHEYRHHGYQYPQYRGRWHNHN